ncbi:hypothetical protein A4H97_14225 [Niastella yeongjuensis]|uniref:Pyrrolo-quinoline quinone repeat domain-containing protein n=1 Tax=Niastella yeongjuensis TaxID=354355 RepID=A0A1V9E3Y3_9BACT|nr:PQQ-binding-like beta-propeller repeat protein [Niastella yeongjuensis]OQP40771.1 hypothetical protein A4H97_14225 [Niastella yeongjuensis]SEP02217.1 Outer membrane protein assembly factor BamB, contains PQQ-like beta-propeller repeat [Niastella yeongjuensis]
MKLPLPIAVIVVLSCFLACSKSKNDQNDQNGQSGNFTSFTVKVLERNPETALLQWDTAFYKVNSKPVLYRVILENTIVADSLYKLTTTIYNLQKNKTYKGKVVAYTDARDTTFAEFNIDSYEGFLYAYTGGATSSLTPLFGCYNTYPVTKAITPQPYIWRISAGEMQSPTLSGDTVFLVSDRKLLAVNATTGNSIWQSTASYSLLTSATYAAGRLYACDLNGLLVCFNSSNGQVLWTYKSATTYVKFDAIPVVDNNKVFVSFIDNGAIDAVDATSGQNIWTATNKYSIGCKRVLATQGVVVFNSGANGQVTALDENTGNIKWTKNGLATGDNRFNPVTVDDKVLVNSGGGALYALNLQTGTQAWIHYNFTPLSDCVAGNGMIYFCKDSTTYPGSGTTGDESYIKCISAKDGHEVWRHGGGKYLEVYSGLVFGKDKVYARYQSGPAEPETIIAYNATTGVLDTAFYFNTPISRTYPYGLKAFCLKRDGVVYYPGSHGNYRSY